MSIQALSFETGLAVVQQNPVLSQVRVDLVDGKIGCKERQVNRQTSEDTVPGWWRDLVEECEARSFC